MCYSFIVKHIKPCEWHRASQSHDSPSRPLRPAAPVVNRLRRRAFQNFKLESSFVLFFFIVLDQPDLKGGDREKNHKGVKTFVLTLCHGH